MISVVIPSYNSEFYLERTLSQFAKQTLQDFEIILVDDASDHDPGLLVTEIAIRESLLLHYYRLSAHSGASTARNVGALRAQGELLCFIDADDIVSPDFLAAFQKEYERSRFDMCFCRYQVLDNRNGRDCLYTIQNDMTCRGNVRFRVSYLMDRTKICHCATVYRRAFFDGNQLRYTEGCRCAEDTELICKALFKAQHITCIDEVLYTYCRHIPSVSHSTPDDRFLDAYKAMRRAQKSIPYLWRPFFALTKKARIHGFILSQFLQSNIQVTYQYCSIGEMMIGLGLSAIMSPEPDTHRKVLTALFSRKICFGKSKYSSSKQD